MQKYGGAVKIHGLCGVSRPRVALRLSRIDSYFRGLQQDEQVYVSDPKALYHIVAKDQDAYEETRYFIMWVSQSLVSVTAKSFCVLTRTYSSNLVCFGKGMVSVIGQL